MLLGIEYRTGDFDASLAESDVSGKLDERPMLFPCSSADNASRPDGFTSKQCLQPFHGLQCTVAAMNSPTVFRAHWFCVVAFVPLAAMLALHRTWGLSDSMGYVPPGQRPPT